MPGGKPVRDKGKRGELDLVHKLPGFKRVGHSFLKTPVDLASDWAVIQVKNYTIGGAAIAANLEELAKVAPEMHHGVAFKVKGKWFIAETLDQFKDEHVGIAKEEE